MAPKLWVLVEWVDESNVISSYGVVKVDIQLYNKTGLQPGELTLLRIEQDIRRAKILRISESKSDVEEQRQILEHQDQQIQKLLQVFIQTVKEIKSKNLLNVQQQTSSHSPIPEVLDVRNDYSESSSDSEANVKINHFKSGNFSKYTSKYTPHQQSTSKQTRSALKANNLSRRSTNSSTPLPSTSAQEDVNYTPQHKHQQSTSKQTRSTLKENNLSRQSTNSVTSLPSTSAQEDINYTPEHKQQESTRKQTRATLTENNLSHRSTISSTPVPSTSAQEGIKSSCDKGSQTHNPLVSVSTIHSLDANLRVIHNNFKHVLTRVNITNWDDLTSMSETEQDKEASNIEQNVGEKEPNNKDNEEVGAEEVIDNKDNEEVGAEEVIDNKDNEEVVAKELLDNNDSEKVDAEEVIENNDHEEVGAKEIIENNVNEEVGAENVIENNDIEEVRAEEVIENNDNEDVGAGELLENNDNEEIGVEEVIENNDNEEVGAEEVIENNDNEEVGAEEVIENNAGEQQVDSSTVNTEQKSTPATLRVRRMSAQTSSDVRRSMVPIGFGNAKVPESVLRDIDWSSYTHATRNLLKAVFSQSVLATHSLTGKSNPAFTGKPVKAKLDPTLVEDIVHTVVTKCRVTKNYVRTCISLKCAEEARALRIRQQPKKARMSQDENDENISPYTSSDEW